jgi:hypothetical protein
MGGMEILSCELAVINLSGRVINVSRINLIIKMAERYCSAFNSHPCMPFNSLHNWLDRLEFAEIRGVFERTDRINLFF